MTKLAARLERIANRQRKAHPGPVNVQVVYYETMPDGSVTFTDALTGEAIADLDGRIASTGNWRGTI